MEGVKSKLAVVVALTLLFLPFITVVYVFFNLEGPVWASEVADVPVPPKPTSGRVLVVSQDGDGNFTTVGDAVANATSGDMIVIKPGVYRESVIVDRKPWLVITGVERDSVILDGGMRLGNGIYVVFSPHVTIANLTVRNYLGNGIFYVSSDYFTVFNVTALNNRVYGVNFLASEKGLVSHVIASGSGDSGIYVGEVTRFCDCVIEYSEAYNNSLGYSGTRANGVTIRYSYFHDNAIGIAPNTLLPDIRMLLLGKWPLELWASNNVIEHNIIENNNNHAVKAAGFAASYGVPVGVGIALIGSHSNIIRNNTIVGNERWGIAEWYFLVPPYGNRYEGNNFNANGVDYWRDGWGFLGCSIGEQASGDTPPPCSLPEFLRITIPNPLKHFELLLGLEIPGSIAVVAAVLVRRTAAKFRENMASRRKHLTASLIDALLAGDIYLLFTTLLVFLGFGASDMQSVVDGIMSMSLLLLPLAYFLWILFYIIYGIVSELTWGATLGKKLTGLKISRYGYIPSKRRILVRNVARFLDLLFFGLVGIVSVLVTKRSVGDLIAGTYLEETHP